MHLVHSPHDGGYYWERFSDWKTSQVFKTEEEAREAKTAGKLRWN